MEGYFWRYMSMGVSVRWKVGYLSGHRILIVVSSRISHTNLTFQVYNSISYWKPPTWHHLTRNHTVWSSSWSYAWETWWQIDGSSWSHDSHMGEPTIHRGATKRNVESSWWQNGLKTKQWFVCNISGYTLFRHIIKCEPFFFDTQPLDQVQPEMF